MRVTAGILGLLLACLLGMPATPASGATAEPSALPQTLLSTAPEFPAGLQWLNTSAPLTLRELRGKVVLLDFWTYGCINCLHVLPDVHRLALTYAQELVVIGVHSAKYDNEAVLANVQEAVRRYGITHPVVNDQDYHIWKAYKIFGWPTQILIDPAGHIVQGFVGEHHYERLDRLIRTTIDVHRRQGTLRQGETPVQRPSPQAMQTPLRYPGKVLADSATSRLFIADTQHHRVVVTDMQGSLLEVIGHGGAGALDGSYATARFRQPHGLAVRGSMLYVADTGNHLIRRVDLQRREVETVLGTGEQARELNVPGTGRQVPLNSPWDVYTQAGSLYIAMAGMHQLWRMDLATAFVEPFSGSSREDLLDGRHSEAALGQPSGVSGDGSQYLYVADSEVNAVRMASLDPSGSITTVAGGGLFTFGDRDGKGSAARLQHPLGVAYAEGAVYIADTYNHKIKVFDVSQGVIRTFAGTGVAGYRDGTAAQAQLYEPGGLSVGGNRLYVADTNNHRVRVIDLTTREVSTLVIRGLTPPRGANAEPVTNGAVEVIRLEEQLLPAAARTAMRFALEFPAGWKLNPAAPGSLAVQVTGDAVRIPPAYRQQTLQPFDPTLTITLDLTHAGAQAHLRVMLSFVACRVDNQALCLPRQVTWEIPVRSQPQARSSALILHYTMTAL